MNTSWQKSNMALSVKKLLALVLCVLLLVQSIHIVIDVTAASSATSTTHTVQEDVYVDIDKTITDMGNRTYKLTLTAESYIKDEYRTSAHAYSEDGIQIIEEDGYYLIELWGGEGGDGGDATDSNNRGGYGGSAGYIYSYVYLKKGQTILFTVGTNGVSDKALIGGSSNGGANEGGDQEIWTATNVGGGGGYSAVYLFDVGAAKTEYSLIESERLNNYIMVAGGGGGGGGAAGIGETSTGRPSGGNAGHITSSVSAHLSADDNNGVAGTYFAGRNGRSSGTKTTYIGKGGTNVPGTMPSTDDFWGLVNWTGVLNPNDWTGTYTDGIDNETHQDINLAAGCGGMGLCHGGGGGAGFCGGSGGAQQGLLKFQNVGGGGGGSSFIRDSIFDQELIWQDVPDYVTDYLNSHNYSDVGGSCVITFLGKEMETVDTSHMQDVYISGSISQYFDILSATVNGKNATVSTASGNIAFAGANIAPDENGYHANSATVDIILRAKDAFAGGNYVPVIDTAFTFTPADHDKITATADPKTDYVNVPIKNFQVIANSYTHNEPGKSYNVSDLFTASSEYTTAKNNVGKSGNYYFLSSVSNHQVYSGTSSLSLSSTVSPRTTSNYKVQFTVTPQTTSYALVGERATAVTFSAYATIRIVSADIADDALNGLTLYATKMLNHDGTNYILNNNVNQETDPVFMPSATTTVTTPGSGEPWYAPADGWYCIQAWGGNGQGSGTARVASYRSATTYKATSNGAAGGLGGYVAGYVYLSQGDGITYDIADASPSNTNSVTNRLTQATGQAMGATTQGGAGGDYTVIMLNGATIMVAGGGGGASGAAAAATTGSATSNDDGNGHATRPSQNISVSNTLQALDTYTGGAGTAGRTNPSYSFWGSNVDAWDGTPGTGATNYRLAGMDVGYDSSGSGYVISQGALAYAQELSSSKGSITSGRVSISLLETTEGMDTSESLYGLTAGGTISKYFNVDEINLKTAFGTTNVTIANGDGSFTSTYTANSTKLASVTYTLTENADGTTSWHAYNTEYSPDSTYTEATVNGVSGNYVTYESALDFVLTLSPKEGFIGGNDVPLIQYGSGADTGLYIEQSGTTMWFPKKDISDYANVKLKYTFDPQGFLPQDKTILCGESIDQTELLIANTISLPSGEDAWKSDFVTTVYPTTAVVSPTVDTTYSFTQQVIPKATAAKAIVLDSVNGVSQTTQATVFVDYSVMADLTHLTYSGPDRISGDEELSARIKPHGGYLLPDTVTVTVGGTVLNASAYTYDQATGIITVPASQQTGNIVIAAEAVVQTFKLFYSYEDPETGETITVQETGHNGEWAAGETINRADLVKYDELNSGVTDRDGYKFSWKWGTADNQPLTEMPAADLYIMGVYEPILYTVTVHYRDEAGNPLAEDAVVYHRMNEAYSVISPNVPGYLAQTAVVTGVMGIENVEVTVTYTKTTGKLNIIYIYNDSQTEAAPAVSQDIQVGDTYSVTSAPIDGYTPDPSVVSGTVNGTQAENGITVYVYYNPNRYTVSFDAQGGTLTDGEQSKTVTYNNIYGFDPTLPEGEQYTELPTPIRTGFVFTGWEDENGNKITEETAVARLENHTLYATWKGQEFTLTVRYQYADGTKAAEDYVTRVEYNTAYEVASPFIEGYTPAPDVSGVMGAGSRIITVTYTIDQHTVTVKYIGPDGAKLQADKVIEQDYNTAYSITSPTFAGYELDGEKNGDDMSTVAGTIGTTDITVLVYYKYIDYTLTITYEDEDGNEMAAPVTQTLHVGNTYSVDSPTFAGFTASQAQVSGTAGTTDVSVTVTYTRNSYTLTVHFVYDQSVADETLRGTSASADYTTTVKYGIDYSVAIPSLDGYYTAADTVDGTMEDGDMELTVYYYDIPVVVSVTVAWGNLNYDYAASTWDPETHQYTIPPVVDGGNRVTVTNTTDSNIAIRSTLSYAALDGFDSILGYFTDSTDAVIEHPTADLAVGENATWYVWIIGYLPDEYTTDQTVGTCTVTIGGAY